MRQKKSLLLFVILTMFSTLNLISCGGGGSDAESNLKIFITSETGSANLTSWTAYSESGSSASGLEAGDAICQYLAEEADLDGTYRAWLSDDSTDAYCHIHGLTGKKADSCEGTLPTPYGPWVRMDDFPFGETIDLITSINQIYAPVKFDENETALSAGDTYFTATGSTGVLDGSYTTCSNWTDGTSDAVYASGGHPMMTALFWTNYAVIQCSASRRLLCMQVGEGPTLPSHSSTGKIVFITSAAHNGNFSGDLTVADAFCQDLAGDASLPGTYKAWLSSSTTDAIDRITEGARVRVDGVKIADSKADLTDAELFSSINVTETGTYLGNYRVWTGTLANGTKYDNLCNDWTSSDSGVYGRVGIAPATNGWWTNNSSSYSCSVSLRLYCFQD